MKKVITILFIFSSILMAYCFNKPVIRLGVISNENIKLLSYSNFIYPSVIKDSVFISFEEKLNKYFNLYHKVEFEYVNYNKFSSNLNVLRNIKISNNIKLDFNINHSNRIVIWCSPIFITHETKYFKMSNKIEYKLSLRNFRFDTSYSNSFALKDDETMNHKLNWSFYFSMPKINFIKFKTSLTVTLENPINNNTAISPLKSLYFNFELALDFNNDTFEKIFNSKKDDDFLDL